MFLAGVKQEDQLPPKPGRGRARGRARGRGRGSPRPRTFSGGDETRKVECQKDLLVVKIDNSGKEHDNSVEVEYWDDDLLEVKSVGRTPPAGSAKAPASRSAKVPESNTAGKPSHTAASPVVKDQFVDSVDDTSRKRADSQSLSAGDDHDESWEDCPDSSEFYGTTDDESKSQSSHKDFVKNDKVKDHHLTLNTKLNPDAAEFQPSPPEPGFSEFLPTSPDFMKTPPGHVKVMDWVSEVTDNLSPTSPPPVEGYTMKKELMQKDCQTTLFKDKAQDEVTTQSSSVEGVTKIETQMSSNVQEQKEDLCEEDDGDELFEIAPEHGEGTSDAPLSRTADTAESPSGANPEFKEDSRIPDEENTGNKSMEDPLESSDKKQDEVQSKEDSQNTQDLGVEGNETSKVPDAKPDSLLEQAETPVHSTQLVEDVTQDDVSTEEKTVTGPSDDSPQKDNAQSDAEVCSDNPEQGKSQDSVDGENKDDDKSSTQAVPSPDTSEDATLESSDKKQDEVQSKEDIVEEDNTKDDQVSESTDPQNVAGMYSISVLLCLCLLKYK